MDLPDHVFSHEMPDEACESEGGHQPVRRSGSMNALRVLVVEDDPLIGMLLADILSEMGYQVSAVEATEAGAVATAARGRPDLMIVDAGLREGSGVSAVEKILRNGFIPHVFVSGAIAAIQAQRPGAIVIQKPFRDVDLARAIEQAFAAVPSGETLDKKKKM
jgi:CheY-like chemotaxis protein